MASKVRKIQFENKRNATSFFDIINYAELMSLQPKDHSQFENHRLTFFALIFITKGKGKHSVNFIDYPYKKGVLFAVGKDNIHKFYKSEADGYVLVFTEDFLLQYMSEKNASRVARVFNELLVSPYQQLNNIEFEQIGQYIEAIKSEFYQIKDDFSHEIIRSHLQIIFNQLLRIKSSENVAFNDHKYLSQFLQFQTLVEHHSEEYNNVSYYADQLCVTTRTLNNITNGVVRKSAKEVIQNIQVLKIKRLLINSNMNITQIALQSGFFETAHFSKFFSKKTGLSPKKFRENFK